MQTDMSKGLKVSSEFYLQDIITKGPLAFSIINPKLLGYTTNWARKKFIKSHTPRGIGFFPYIFFYE